MTSISKHVYIENLDGIVNQYNNTYRSAIKMKPVDVKSKSYIDSSKEINSKDRTINKTGLIKKNEIGDIVRILKYNNIFTKGTLQIGLKKLFLIKKVKNINDLNGEEIVVTFQKKNSKI